MNFETIKNNLENMTAKEIFTSLEKLNNEFAKLSWAGSITIKKFKKEQHIHLKELYKRFPKAETFSDLQEQFAV